MKNLTEKEFMEAPAIVQYVYTAAMFETPIGVSIYTEAVEKHPEYFDDVLEHRAKWDAIPQEVHDVMRAELKELMLERYPDSEGSPLVTSKGIAYWLDHPKEYEVFSSIIEDRHKVFTELEIQMYRKHYSPYGIKHPYDSTNEAKNKQHDEQKERRQVRRPARSRWDAIYTPRK